MGCVCWDGKSDSRQELVQTEKNKLFTTVLISFPRPTLKNIWFQLHLSNKGWGMWMGNLTILFCHCQYVKTLKVHYIIWSSKTFIYCFAYKHLYWRNISWIIRIFIPVLKIRYPKRVKPARTIQSQAEPPKCFTFY